MAHVAQQNEQKGGTLARMEVRHQLASLVRYRQAHCTTINISIALTQPTCTCTYTDVRGNYSLSYITTYNEILRTQSSSMHPAQYKRELTHLCIVVNQTKPPMYSPSIELALTKLQESLIKALLQRIRKPCRLDKKIPKLPTSNLKTRKYSQHSPASTRENWKIKMYIVVTRTALLPSEHTPERHVQNDTNNGLTLRNQPRITFQPPDDYRSKSSSVKSPGNKQTNKIRVNQKQKTKNENKKGRDDFTELFSLTMTKL
jgi:hypothetical protein